MATHELRSEIPGNVWKIEVAPGDQVSDGDVVVILESMKMEVPLAAPCTGTVTSLAIETEQFVGEGDLVAMFESPDQ